MALQFVDTDGTLVIPQATAKWETAPSNAGIATRGVIVLVGEADSGPSYAEAADGLKDVTFGPGQFSAVEALFGAGPLVDAFRNVANPSRDPSVRGAPTQVICVKSNVGAKAQGALSSGYGVLRAKQAGASGNLISVQVVSATAETAASLAFAFARTSTAETLNVAANGGTAVLVDVTAADPAAFVTANVAALAVQNIALSGGVASAPALGLVAVTAALAAAGNVITVSLTGGTWATTPVAGQTLTIADTSSITGAANANSGSYIVTSATASTVVAVKVVDATGATLTAPVAVAPGAAANAGMCDTYTPVVFTSTAAGAKSVTLFRSGAASHLYTSAGVAVTASQFASSAVEAQASILVNRSSTNTSETLKAGGDVCLSIGHVGTSSAPVVVDATTITLSGGIVLVKSNFKTLGDVAAYISAQPNWYAVVPAAFRSLAPSCLDLGTYDANQNGVTLTAPARIKSDAFDIIAAVASSSAVEFIVAPTSGLPTVQATFFLAGGSKGGTSDATVLAALAAAETVRANFVVPCISQDASADIAAGLTDVTSTYTIASVNAALAAHLAKCSQFKKRRPRQGFGSFRGTFSQAKAAAQSLAYFRLAMSFEDVLALSATGSSWFQPWMGAVIAAGMQAAGFYRPIFNKSIGVTGVRQAAGDFKTNDDDAVESALLAGLVVIRERDGGGFAFVSDQTTYAADANFVYNSIQAIYVADIIAMTVAQRMEAAFVGQSFADVTASVALSYLKGIMADLKRLKLIAASDDAVDGYKDAKVEIRPPAMLVSAEVKEATGVYFIPIKFLVTQVQQTASQG